MIRTPRVITGLLVWLLILLWATTPSYIFLVGLGSMLLVGIYIWLYNSGNWEALIGATILRPWVMRWKRWALENVGTSGEKLRKEDIDFDSEPWLPQSLRQYYSRLSLMAQFVKMQKEKHDKEAKEVAKRIAKNKRRRKASDAAKET